MSSANIKSVCVLGLGYIGLPTASVIASRSVQVIGIDVKEEVVAKINKGEIHIVEPDLEAVTAHAVQQGYLRAATKPEVADAFNEVQRSSQYPGGVALRFARVKGYRPDKSAAEADTIDAVRAWQGGI